MNSIQHYLVTEAIDLKGFKDWVTGKLNTEISKGNVEKIELVNKYKTFRGKLDRGEVRQGMADELATKIKYLQQKIITKTKELQLLKKSKGNYQIAALVLGGAAISAFAYMIFRHIRKKEMDNGKSKEDASKIAGDSRVNTLQKMKYMASKLPPKKQVSALKTLNREIQNAGGQP
jgi:hypothetical protein